MQAGLICGTHPAQCGHFISRDFTRPLVSSQVQKKWLLQISKLLHGFLLFQSIIEYLNYIHVQFSV